MSGLGDLGPLLLVVFAVLSVVSGLSKKVAEIPWLGAVARYFRTRGERRQEIRQRSDNEEIAALQARVSGMGEQLGLMQDRLNRQAQDAEKRAADDVSEREARAAQARRHLAWDWEVTEQLRRRGVDVTDPPALPV